MMGYSIEPGGEFAIYKRPSKKCRQAFLERIKSLYGPGYHLRIINHQECVRTMEFCERLLGRGKYEPYHR